MHANKGDKVRYEQLQAPRVALDGRVALAVITRRGTQAFCSLAVVTVVVVGLCCFLVVEL